MTTLAQRATVYSVAEKSVMDGRFKGEEGMGAAYKAVRQSTMMSAKESRTTEDFSPLPIMADWRRAP